jgi:hypothetical protein
MESQDKETQANEAMVLELLRRQRSIKLEAAIALLPYITWNQVFQCVDALSRRGEIILRRRGFDYEIVSGDSERERTACSV